MKFLRIKKKSEESWKEVEKAGKDGYSLVSVVNEDGIITYYLQSK